MKQIKRMTQDPEVIPHKEDKTIKVLKGPPHGNWLKDLTEGTAFYSRPRSNPIVEGYICTLYRILKHNKNTTHLWIIMEDQYLFVDTLLFSLENILVEVRDERNT